MKPFDLYSFISLNAMESVSKNKLKFILIRAKLALDNMYKLGWTDEQIKVAILDAIKRLRESHRPCTVQYILGIIINNRKSPGIKSTEDQTAVDTYADWIKREQERLKNA